MTAALIVIAVLCSLAALGAGVSASLEHQKSRQLQNLLEAQGLVASVGFRLVVHTKDGQSIKGVLVRIYADCLALERVEYLAGGNSREVGGDALVPLTNLSWTQRFVEGA